MTVHNSKSSFSSSNSFSEYPEVAARRSTLRSAKEKATKISSRTTRNSKAKDSTDDKVAETVGKRKLPAFLQTRGKKMLAKALEQSGKKAKARSSKKDDARVSKAKGKALKTKTSSKDEKVEPSTPPKAAAKPAPIKIPTSGLKLDLSFLPSDDSELPTPKIADDNDLPTPKLSDLKEVEKKVLKAPKCSKWKPRCEFSIEDTIKKMFKNAVKTINEHIKSEKLDAASAYATAEKALPHRELLLHAKPQPRLAFTVRHAEARGVRPTMEDAHFYTEIPQGSLAAVFDGHGGAKVANYANEQFQKRFSQALEKANGNVHQAFEVLIHEIHLEVMLNDGWAGIGTTAVICFIDKTTNLIYTATLGDSEANIYRTIDGSLNSIPLSCVRDWSSKKDALRAAIAMDRPQYAEEWPKATNSKMLRYEKVAFYDKDGRPKYSTRLNVARAIGDRNSRGTKEKPAVIDKPKITINMLLPGDILTLVCDGVKDFASELDIVKQIYRKEHASGFLGSIIDSLQRCKKGPVDLAHRLLDFALNDKKSQDNVTVMTIKAALADSGTGSGSSSSKSS
jgi:serine/threonine protein phosphatase PrpC